MEALQTLFYASRRLGLPDETGKELIRYLMVQKYSGTAGQHFHPSSSLMALLHYVLLNTDVRCAVEAEIGKIKHAEFSSPWTLGFDELWDRRQVIASFLLPNN